MGRRAGYIALWCGVANGAEDILLPEKYDFDEQRIINNIIDNRKRGKKHHIIVNAEGIGHSTSMARRIEAATGIETRATILGHMQRGGRPTCKDRYYASMMGAYATEILIAGKSPGTETKKIVAYLPDSIYLNSWMTVEQIIDYFADFYEDFSKERAYDMLQNLNITPKMRLKSLSKGNKEKVCLILVMSRQARLYVLDEPIAGVDPAARDYVISTIINNYNPEATVLISTHLIADIEQILDEVLFLQQGRIVLHKTVDEIRAENAKSVDELFREVFRW
jgi:ABC-2 type transport system ATP-binding protein